MNPRQCIRGRRSRWLRSSGLTLIELLIGMFLAGLVSAGALNFYQAQNEVYLAQADISDRQGNLRYALNELTTQVRRAGYMVPGSDFLRVSATRDTLTVFIGSAVGGGVDTLRYYLNRALPTPSLVKKVNGKPADVIAEAIDSVVFVPVPLSPINKVAISLVSTPQKEYSGTSLVTRRRVGVTVNLRNR